MLRKDVQIWLVAQKFNSMCSDLSFNITPLVEKKVLIDADVITHGHLAHKTVFQRGQTGVTLFSA